MKKVLNSITSIWLKANNHLIELKIDWINEINKYKLIIEIIFHFQYKIKDYELFQNL